MATLYFKNMKPTESLTITAEANISKCGKYRYWLNRTWDNKKPIGVFICMNPSTATSAMCDLTMCNCNNLAMQWGWGGFYIVNLYAYRATDPNDLKKQNNPIGKLNDHAITDICANASMIVLAWGNGNKKRANDVLSLLGSKKLHCIYKNKGGGFLHPSRIKTKDYPHAKKI